MTYKAIQYNFASPFLSNESTRGSTFADALCNEMCASV